jgi:hypothetical protein
MCLEFLVGYGMALPRDYLAFWVESHRQGPSALEDFDVLAAQVGQPQWKQPHQSLARGTRGESVWEGGKLRWMATERGKTAFFSVFRKGVGDLLEAQRFQYHVRAMRSCLLAANRVLVTIGVVHEVKARQM